ncbi:hypothetical protein AK830_g4599 [Neonectria ditissima]|uniref:Aminotransferase class I/classII domain-containing protein n=1 Tax=Neonectria ditissima TaxID=78410 RepID=A0A0N8H7K0_9HYPO|nr:hypothetical protein AK830_g4599 [Neonectria ditissima]
MCKAFVKQVYAKGPQKLPPLVLHDGLHAVKTYHAVAQIIDVSVRNAAIKASLLAHRPTDYFNSPIVSGIILALNHLDPTGFGGTGMACEYTYRPLTQPDEIRVLTLNPGSGAHDLEGTISHMQLPDSAFTQPPSFDDDLESVWKWNPIPSQNGFSSQIRVGELTNAQTKASFIRSAYTQTEYDALSYTWGNSTKTDMITVNHNSLGITENLHAALIHLRSPVEERRLWIDAICIDQTNIQERNHQVQLMKRIFSGASSVIVWLGGAEGDVGSALQMMQDSMSSEYGDDAFNTLNTFQKVLNALSNVFKYSENLLKGLTKLFNRSWWRRMWIVQEVVMARDLVVLLGDIIVPWSFLTRLCYEIQQNEYRQQPLGPLFRACGYKRFTALQNFRENGSIPLARLLQDTRDYQASDPRDKLYALLGITSDVTTAELIPDYAKPVERVFEDLVKFVAMQQDNLDILSSGRHFCVSGHGSQSWLPDWQNSSGLRPLNIKRAPYNAADGTRAIVDMSQFPRVLIVEAFVVDTVKLFGGSAPLAHEHLPTIRCRHYVAAQKPNIKTMELFWRMITADVDHLGNRATLAFKRQIHSFVNDADKRRPNPTSDFSDAATRAVIGRRFFITRSRRLGLAPADIQLEDTVVIIKGCRVPLIIRAVGNHWVLIGEAYVSGIMYGEVISGWKLEPERHLQGTHQFLDAGNRRGDGLCQPTRKSPTTTLITQPLSSHDNNDNNDSHLHSPPTKTHLSADSLLYRGSVAGGPRFPQALATHLNEYLAPHTPIAAASVQCVGAATAMHDILAWAVADAGDAVLTSRPVYGRFELDFGNKAQVRVVYADTHPEDCFDESVVERFEEALRRSRAEGVEVKMVLIVNPNNPLGKCYPRATLVAIMRFCQTHQLHLLSDEIYACSVFGTDSPDAAPFTSALAIDAAGLLDPALLHVTYGLSKDFGAAGLRLGAVVTRSRPVLAAVAAAVRFHNPSGPSLAVATAMLEDRRWCRAFVASSRVKLAAAHAHVTGGLRGMGVRYLAESNAGFFVWVDLSPYLPAELGGEANAEFALARKLMDAGVFLHPREEHSSRPGWFRLVYTQDPETVTEGLRRIKIAIS